MNNATAKRKCIIYDHFTHAVLLSSQCFLFVCLETSKTGQCEKSNTRTRCGGDSALFCHTHKTGGLGIFRTHGQISVCL